MTATFMRVPLLLVVSALLALAACTGPSGAQRDAEEPEDQMPEEGINMAEYEDFDAAFYREPEPTRDLEVEHDVPERLMEGRADEGVTRTVQGYRIQIYSSQDREEAREMMEEAISWWEDEQDEAGDLFPEELPVEVTYGQPYYRVRIGNFVSRSEAQEALSVVQERFGDAFISPDTVTITQ